MAIAAVPAYLGSDFSQASPGLRFGMYLPLWGVDGGNRELLWTTHDVNYRTAGPQQTTRSYKDSNKASALRGALRLNPSDRAVMAGLEKRQSALAASLREQGRLVSLHAIAVAPFTSGLGNEHPLENGFAFLNPYGLPYLPGSGVKGVLRQAARELASGIWGDTHGWTEPAIDALFGRTATNGESELQRGALVFWDAIPQVDGEQLTVEVMTPHQSDYYQKGATPHESGQPNPINFLTVPPRSRFAFHVQCNVPFLARLAPDLARDDRWQRLVSTAFEHAYQWLGFGAKTAVGYGAMAADPAVEEQRRRKEREAQAARETAEAERRRQETLARLTPIEREIREFLDARADRNQPEIPALLGALKGGQWSGDTKVAVAQSLQARMKASGQWREQSAKKNPQKDFAHQDTLLVMQWLQGK